MKKLLFLIFVCCFFSGFAQDGTINITAIDTKFVYKVCNNKRLYQSYLGGRTPDETYADKRTEFWPSDNTDGLEQVYIQWAYSYFFPANTIAADVTSWGKQSLKFRTDAAMMDKLGYDIDVMEFSKEDLLFSQEAIANYSRFSKTIHQGNLFRLVSPYESNQTVLMYCDEAKENAVLFSFILSAIYRETFSPVRLQGLSADKKYMIKEINLMPSAKSSLSCNGKEYSETYLMNIGIDASKTNADPITSTVLEITTIN